MAPMAFKHFTPNFKRARTFTFVHAHILDVRERAPPVTPNSGCARQNGKRPTICYNALYKILNSICTSHSRIQCLLLVFFCKHCATMSRVDCLGAVAMITLIHPSLAGN